MRDWKFGAIVLLALLPLITLFPYLIILVPLTAFTIQIRSYRKWLVRKVSVKTADNRLPIPSRGPPVK